MAPVRRSSAAADNACAEPIVTHRSAAQPLRQRPRPAGAAARRAERPTRVTGTIRPDPGSRWSARRPPTRAQAVPAGQRRRPRTNDPDAGACRAATRLNVHSQLPGLRGVALCPVTVGSGPAPGLPINVADQLRLLGRTSSESRQQEHPQGHPLRHKCHKAP